MVAHDWGAVIGWNLCLYRPDRIIAYASLSTHMMPRNPVGSPVKHLRSICGEHYYVCQFQVYLQVVLFININVLNGIRCMCRYSSVYGHWNS